MSSEENLESFVQVQLKKPDDFLVVKETLSRIGLLSTNVTGKKRLYQSCHILHKKGKYYLVHFKEMFILDGKDTSFSEEDKGRRNTIANLLNSWGLLEIVDSKKTVSPTIPMSKINIVPFKDKQNYDFVVKYTIGGK